MKLLIPLLFIFSFSISAQSISKAEYEKAFKFAVSETNSTYPHIFKVVTTFTENGKTVRTTEVNENEAAGRYRIKRTVFADNHETNTYQLTVGYGNVFCSDDQVIWKPSKYECPSETKIYGIRNPERTEYSLTEKTVNGQPVKIYREYSVFARSKESRIKDFRETISTIDSRGYFITVVDTEGTLDPKTITLTREQSWLTQAKIEPVASPIK